MGKPIYQLVPDFFHPQYQLQSHAVNMVARGVLQVRMDKIGIETSRDLVKSNQKNVPDPTLNQTIQTSKSQFKYPNPINLKPKNGPEALSRAPWPCKPGTSSSAAQTH